MFRHVYVCWNRTILLLGKGGIPKRRVAATPRGTRGEVSTRQEHYPTSSESVPVPRNRSGKSNQRGQLRNTTRPAIGSASGGLRECMLPTHPFLGAQSVAWLPYLIANVAAGARTFLMWYRSQRTAILSRDGWGCSCKQSSTKPSYYIERAIWNWNGLTRTRRIASAASLSGTVPCPVSGKGFIHLARLVTALIGGPPVTHPQFKKLKFDEMHSAAPKMNTRPNDYLGGGVMYGRGMIPRGG